MPDCSRSTLLGAVILGFVATVTGGALVYGPSPPAPDTGFTPPDASRPDVKPIPNTDTSSITRSAVPSSAGDRQFAITQSSHAGQGVAW
jgi:hypothetical protein